MGMRRRPAGCAALVGYLLATALWGAPLAGQTPQPDPTVLVLESFERRAIDLERGSWRSNTGGVISQEHATHGRRSLWTTFPRAGAVLWSLPKRLPQDWRGYEKLKADIFVDGSALLLAVQITDEDGARYLIPYYYLRPGANTLEVDLAGVARMLDVSRIASIQFRAVRAPERGNVAYFDNLRLTRGEPETIPAELAQVPESVAVAGNLVKNPGFEYALGGWQFWGRFDWGEYRAAVARSGEAHSGVACASIKSVGYSPGRGGLATDRIWVPAAGRYRFSVFVKGTDGAVFRAGLAHGRILGVAKDVPASPQWQELNYVVAVKDERKPLRIWLYNVGMGTLYLDDVVLVPEETVEQPAERFPEPPAEVRLRGDLLYVNGEPFFPLGAVGGEDAAETLAGSPFNLAVAPRIQGNPRPFLDRGYRVGLMGVANLSESLRVHVPTAVGGTARRLKGHPALLGWLLAEEPDGEAYPAAPPEVRLARRTLQEAVGNDLPVILRLRASAVSSFYQYRGLADIVMVSTQAAGSTRPFDLGAVTRPLDQAKGALGGEAPIWAVLNLGDEKTLEPTPEELSVTAYLAITHGADGVLWEPLFYLQEHPAVKEALLRVLTELRQLTPALVSPTLRVITATNKRTMHGTARRYQDQLYLIIVNASPQEQPATTFTLKGVPKAAPVEVLFEDRTLTLEGRVLTDDFGPYQRHVYRLEAPPEVSPEGPGGDPEE